MVKKAVYLETSVIGYATSRPSRDLIVAAHQQITKEWFTNLAKNYQLFVSESTIREAASGDSEAAKSRLAFIHDIPSLDTTNEVGDLASKLVGSCGIPRKSAEDAIHIALAAVHGIEFLLTWNCKHIANAAMRKAIDEVCRSSNYNPPVICTPEELLHGD